jgi:hypothetical protein
MPLVVNLVSADEAAAAQADAEVVEEVVILRSARAQEQAREHADRGEFEQARKLLAETADELRTIAPRSKKAGELLEQAEHLGTYSASMGPESYSAAVRKQMRFHSRSTSERRRKRPPSPPPSDGPA